MPAVDALIVSYNTRELTRQTLATLAAHRPPAATAQLTISVLDNASTDGSAEMIRREFPEVRLIESARNLGFGAACNELARTTGADHVMLLNSDVIVEQDVVSPLLAALRGPDVLLTAPRLRSLDGTVQLSAPRRPTLVLEAVELVRTKRLGRLLSRLVDLDGYFFACCARDDTVAGHSARAAQFIWATCWLMRTADATPLFDTTFPMYDEDLDFCARAAEHGRTLLYVPEAEIVHIGGASSTSEAKRARMRRARRRYYERHGGRVKALVYSAILAVVPRLVDLVEAVPNPRRRDRPAAS